MIWSLSKPLAVHVIVTFARPLTTHPLFFENYWSLFSFTLSGINFPWLISSATTSPVSSWLITALSSHQLTCFTLTTHHLSPVSSCLIIALWSRQFTSFFITTLTICHSFTLSFQTQNISFSYISSTTRPLVPSVWLQGLLDCLSDFLCSTDFFSFYFFFRF